MPAYSSAQASLHQATGTNDPTVEQAIYRHLPNDPASAGAVDDFSQGNALSNLPSNITEESGDLPRLKLPHETAFHRSHCHPS
jgi:hypothetical protein